MITRRLCVLWTRYKHIQIYKSGPTIAHLRFSYVAYLGRRVGKLPSKSSSKSGHVSKRHRHAHANPLRCVVAPPCFAPPPVDSRSNTDQYSVPGCLTRGHTRPCANLSLRVCVCASCLFLWRSPSSLLVTPPESRVPISLDTIVRRFVLVRTLPGRAQNRKERHPGQLQIRQVWLPAPAHVPGPGVWTLSRFPSSPGLSMR